MSTTKRSFDTAYWADERVPDLTTLLEPHGIDVAAFSEWLGPLLGNYRGIEQVRSSIEVAPAKQAEFLKKLRAALQVLLPLLHPDAMPPRTGPVLFMEAYNRGLDADAISARLRIDATMLDGLLGATLLKIEALPSKAGRKPSTARDTLLAAIVERLRQDSCTAKTARALAEQILVLSSVAVPTGERSIRRVTSGGRKSPKS